MAKTLPKGIRLMRGRFQVRMMVDGKSLTRTFDTLAQAVAHRDKLQARREHIPDRFETLDGIMESLLEDARKRLAPGTVDYWDQQFTDLKKAWPADTYLHAITPAAIQKYLDLETARTSSSTASKRYAALSKIFREALRRKLLVVSPLAGIRKPRENKVRRQAMTPRELGAIVKTIRESGRQKCHEHADLIELMFWTGARRSEIARLEAGDIDLGAGLIRIDGKCGVRSIPIHPSLREVLQRMDLPDSGRLYPGGGSYVSTTLRRWAERLDLKGRLRPHVLRHSFATAMVSGGAPIAHVSKLLGHADLKLTMRYYSHSEPELLSALDRLRY